MLLHKVGDAGTVATKRRPLYGFPVLQVPWHFHASNMLLPVCFSLLSYNLPMSSPSLACSLCLVVLLFLSNPNKLSSKAKTLLYEKLFLCVPCTKKQPASKPLANHTNLCVPLPFHHPHVVGCDAEILQKVYSEKGWVGGQPHKKRNGKKEPNILSFELNDFGG